MVELDLDYMLDTAVVVAKTNVRKRLVHLSDENLRHLGLLEEVLLHLDHLDTVVDHLGQRQVSRRAREKSSSAAMAGNLKSIDAGGLIVVRTAEQLTPMFVQ